MTRDHQLLAAWKIGCLVLMIPVNAIFGPHCHWYNVPCISIFIHGCLGIKNVLHLGSFGIQLLWCSLKPSTEFGKRMDIEWMFVCRKYCILDLRRPNWCDQWCPLKPSTECCFDRTIGHPGSPSGVPIIGFACPVLCYTKQNMMHTPIMHNSNAQ